MLRSSEARQFPPVERVPLSVPMSRRRAIVGLASEQTTLEKFSFPRFAYAILRPEIGLP